MKAFGPIAGCGLQSFSMTRPFWEKESRIQQEFV